MICGVVLLLTLAFLEKTALAGQIQKEISCLPVENAEYRLLMDRRAKQTMKPKRETKLLTGIVSSHGGNLLAPGTLGPSGNFDTFIVSLSCINHLRILTGLEKYRTNSWETSGVQGSTNSSE